MKMEAFKKHCVGSRWLKIKTYEKNGRFIDFIPLKLKIQVTRTRYISDEQCIIKSTD